MNHTQTITVGDGSGKRGNCLQAAVASWVDADSLDAVPDFANFGPTDESGYSIWWWDLFLGWFAHRGYLIRTVGLSARPILEGREWPIPEERCIVYGDSPRGQRISHAVVGEHGQIVWDPHPDQTGLAAVRGAWVPERIDELKARARAYDQRKTINEMRAATGLPPIGEVMELSLPAPQPGQIGWRVNGRFIPLEETNAA